MDVKINLTILLAVFNGEKTLNKCLESLQCQTFQNFNVVSIDDNSSDSTKAILLSWQKKIGPKRFSIIKNEKNIGLTKALNKGLENIFTEYTARIDADDWWHSKKIEKQMVFLENNPDYGIIGCNYINFNKNKKIKVILPKEDKDIKEAIIKNNPFAHSCVIFKTNLVKSVGKYDENIRYGQDYELWLRCFLRTKFYNIQEFLCARTINDNISVEKQNAQMRQSIKTKMKYIKKYKHNWKNYLYLLKPLLIILSPVFIKNIKRKYL